MAQNVEKYLKDLIKQIAEHQKMYGSKPAVIILREDMYKELRDSMSFITSFYPAEAKEEKLFGIPVQIVP